MRRSNAPIVAIFAALSVALAIAILPDWRLEAAVSASGLPALFPAAAPPLGMTARITVMFAAALLVALPLWIGLLLLIPVKRKPARRVPVPPSVRRADAHPDAPPRAPVRAARDLGKPFLDPLDPVETEIPLPRDLDVPMAIFDPAAVPQVPAAPPQSVRPLFRTQPCAAETRPQGAACCTDEPGDRMAETASDPVEEAVQAPEPMPESETVQASEPEPTPASEPVAAPAPIEAPELMIVAEPELLLHPEAMSEPEAPTEPEAPMAPDATTSPDSAPALHAVPEPAPLPTIDVLLDRLDEGLQRRRTAQQQRAEASKPVHSTGLASALGALRRMAGGE